MNSSALRRFPRKSTGRLIYYTCFSHIRSSIETNWSVAFLSTTSGFRTKRNNVKTIRLNRPSTRYTPFLYFGYNTGRIVDINNSLTIIMCECFFFYVQELHGRSGKNTKIPKCSVFAFRRTITILAHTALDFDSNPSFDKHIILFHVRVWIS